MERIVLRDVCDIIDGPHATPTKTESGPVYLGIDAITEDGRLNDADLRISPLRIIRNGHGELPPRRVYCILI